MVGVKERLVKVLFPKSD
ncbi:hypothetical protein LINPERHAP1_LOCUS24972 [Linum perenne]